jgi:site-specific DNA-adenine methylase
MTSYVRYLGAKTFVADQLAEKLYPLPGETYIELMVGGGSVLFEKTPAQYTIINDVDPDIILMHQTVAVAPDKVRAETKRLAASRLTHQQIQRERSSGSWFSLTDPQRAARMIFLLSCAVNGRVDSPFPASPMTKIKFKPDKDLLPWADALQGVTFESLHYHDFLERYVRHQKKLRSLIYADPPYTMARSGQSYHHTFLELDHVLLAYELTEIIQCNGGERQVRVVISYDDDPGGFIRSLNRPEFGWRVGTLAVPNAAGNRVNVTDELLITNFDPQPVPITTEPRPGGDWKDIPNDGLVIGGVPFTQRACCEKERLALMLNAQLRGRCRVCDSEIVVSV